MPTLANITTGHTSPSKDVAAHIEHSSSILNVAMVCFISCEFNFLGTAKTHILALYQH